MALATRPKPKVQHKKRRALHHRQSRPYLKTYWPYLPMLGIVSLGALVNSRWPAGLVELDSSVQGTTRIEALSGHQNSWSLVIIIAMAGIAFGVFVFQHWFRFQRVLNRGERFIVKHPVFDIALVLIFTAGVILTRVNVAR